MTVKEELDKLIEHCEAVGIRRIELYLGKNAQAAFQNEMRPYLTHRTQSWRGKSYRGCPIYTAQDDDANYVVVGDHPAAAPRGDEVTA